MKRLMRSFAFAGNGIRVAIVGQPNMRIHSVVAVVATLSGFYYDISNQEWCMVIFAMSLVVTAELLNSSMEGLVDLLEPNQRALAGKVKDMAAGGVLVAAISAASIGLLVFFKYFIA